ncbi:radical SAM protein [Dehalococcoides mccartyi]|uniref:radical SAM protein n=1 Tax=Dehalococcoides mccartyi TaxID=61435 RepID=UPI0003C82849|nr:radical SAM protein [Dehalococcoides mccartyi]AHB13023.1 radical SAM domain-containing protein [Dehalococcoides mccartyi GY50]
MKVYHLIYEPSYRSAVFHHWTECNLGCKGCFCKAEKLDFGLFPDALERLKNRPPETAPERFIESTEEALGILSGYPVERAVFIGTEPTLDPELPALAKALHRKYGSYNILLTNGVKQCALSDMDEIIFSLKAVTNDIYKAYTGRSNEKTLENFKKVHASGKKLQAECLLIPGLIEADEVEKIAVFIAKADKDITLRIDGYFPIPGCPWRGASTEEVAEAAKRALKHLSKVNYLTADLPRQGEPPVRLFG